MFGVGLLLVEHRHELNDTLFFIAMGVIGVGFGLNFSQLGNINLSSVDESDSSEVGGLQGTAQNLGAALGTAIIGSILLGGLIGSFHNKVEDNPNLPRRGPAGVSSTAPMRGSTSCRSIRSSRRDRAPGCRPIRSTPSSIRTRLPRSTRSKVSLLGVGVLSALGFLFTRKLPTERVGEEPAAAGSA